MEAIHQQANYLSGGLFKTFLRRQPWKYQQPANYSISFLLCSNSTGYSNKFSDANPNLFGQACHYVCLSVRTCMSGLKSPSSYVNSQICIKTQVLMDWTPNVAQLLCRPEIHMVSQILLLLPTLYWPLVQLLRDVGRATKLLAVRNSPLIPRSLPACQSLSKHSGRHGFYSSFSICSQILAFQ